MFRQSTNQNHYPVFGLWVTSLDGINGRSALVNIRQKGLSSSVGFRKRMTSRSPRGIYFIPILWFVWRSDVCFEVLSCFFDHPSIDSNKKMPLSPFKGCFEVSSLFFLRGVKDLSVDAQITRLGDNYAFTGKNNRFPFLDILGYLKNTHKNTKFGRVRQVPIISGNLVANSLVGTCLTLPNLGFLRVFSVFTHVRKQK